MTHLIIGGGAAGFFGAIRCAESNPEAQVILLEKTKQLLNKVRISGGGRCNVTHACFDPALLVNNYPRGRDELRGPFTRFQPRDTVAWFGERGVELKKEEDGRMFPVTDNSQTIIDCLTNEAKQNGVQVRTGSKVERIERENEGFKVILRDEDPIECRTLLLAPGSSPEGHSLAASLGHTITELVPSLFTFNIPGSPLEVLSGISVDKVRVTLPEAKLEQQGPLLITHWGFSGPAVLKLSAWGARTLHSLNYRTPVIIDWLPDFTLEQLQNKLKEQRNQYPKKQVFADLPFALPRNLWKALLPLENDIPWAQISNTQINQIAAKLHADCYQIQGRTTYKSEFVTCGGVKLSEVNFKTMESRICPGLFFAGEVLDIDGVTGGFNFQAAWTTSWIAGSSM